MAALRAPGKNTAPRIAAPAISARLSARITLETREDGSIAAFFDGPGVGLGTFSAAAIKRAAGLRAGLPLASLAGGRAVDKEIDLLVRRLARHGLLEYRLARGDHDQVVIEPQGPDYWPQAPGLGDAETVVLSRFA